MSSNKYSISNASLSLLPAQYKSLLIRKYPNDLRPPNNAPHSVRIASYWICRIYCIRAKSWGKTWCIRARQSPANSYNGNGRRHAFLFALQTRNTNFRLEQQSKKLARATTRIKSHFNIFAFDSTYGKILECKLRQIVEPKLAELHA